MKVSIGRAAREFGVSRELLRKWESEGKIEVDRASNGRRRYDLEKLSGAFEVNSGASRVTLAYARVSNADQSELLDKQTSLLESFCSINGWPFQTLTDIGSSVNFRNRGMRQLIRRICAGEVSRLLITNTNRLPRMGSELIFTLCEQFETELVVLNAPEFEDTEADFAEDVKEIVDAFSASLYEMLGSSKSNILNRLRTLSSELVA